MTTTLVTGATGTLGAPTVTRLRAAGHCVRALSRRSGHDLTTGNLLTGEGIPEAVAGADTILHLATGRRGKEMSRQPARCSTPPPPPAWGISCSSPSSGSTTYRSATTGTRSSSRAPSGVGPALHRPARYPVPLLRGVDVHRAAPPPRRPRAGVPPEPIAVDAVAERLVELACSAPAGRVADIGGPEQQSLRDLARLWADAAGIRRPVVPLSLPGSCAAHRAGSALVPGPHTAGRPSPTTWPHDRARSGEGAAGAGAARGGGGRARPVDSCCSRRASTPMCRRSTPPPFSEHLFRDFGGASLGLAVVLTAAAVWTERRLVVVALVAYLAFSVPHLGFHLGHLHGLERDDGHGAGRRPRRVGVLPLALLVVALRHPPSLSPSPRLDREKARDRSPAPAEAVVRPRRPAHAPTRSTASGLPRNR